jgi:hypothetical protein
MNRLKEARQPISFWAPLRLVIRVGFNAALGDNKAEQLAFRHPEDAFLSVELDPVRSEMHEGLLQVLDQVVGLPGLDHNAVDVNLNDLFDKAIEASLHVALVHHPGILEAEGHRHLVVCAERGNE